MDSIRADRFDCVAPSVVAQRLDKYKAALASEQSGGKHSIRSAAGPRYFFIAVVSRVLLPTRRLHLRRGGREDVLSTQTLPARLSVIATVASMQSTRRRAPRLYTDPATRP
jgi:hypothetical protein